ncbi:uncharacterized protein BJ171DRAFT_596543 [Polychytrium aggregatum]|uniref:uncharacterized protein n=1 Tax=Polychytrium aggregatum TaxID=110093 RepID=UPI0022FE51D5|nr:uncharacterized protein BJ171DRAFT_596543 [Polychytrium aggregatum]KAI9207519.1 hypothetical protein BJ171DRAFT_596543 [Polychytrium aggregatum]
MLFKSVLAAAALLGAPAVLAQDSLNFTQGLNSLISAKKVAIQGNYIVGPLKNIRNTVLTSVLPLGETGRGQVAAEVDKLFDIWANRDSKIQHYGFDAIPVKDQITKNYKSYTSDVKFHEDLAALFLAARDQHTNYYIPAPYGCVRSILPWSFDFLQNDDYWNPVVVVSGLASYGPAVDPTSFFGADLMNQIKQITPGDELVSIDSVEFGPTFFEQYQDKTQGANDMGGMRNFANILVYRASVFYPLPTEEEDNRTFVFKKPSGQLITIKVPYFSRLSLACLAPILNPQATVNDFLGEAEVVTPKIPHMQPNTDFSNPILAEFKEVFPAGNVAPVYQSTPDTKLSWTIYKENGANLGVIFLADFEPSTSVTNIVALIRGLLVNELADTDAVVFDIRSNGGGDITMANSIPQLFKPDFVQNGARALISDTNTAIFHSPVAPLVAGPQWITAYDAGLNSKAEYGDLGHFGDFNSVNQLGNVYLKPVAIFNDAVCFSSCDMFSANMQDSQTAYIFGQDGQTGGGGANVVEHASYLVQYFGTVNHDAFNGTRIFSPLPYTTFNAQNGGLGKADMRVGWRQTVRNGVNNGALIEDDGVFSEYTLRPTWDDLFSGKKALSQFDFIASTLKDLGHQTGQSSLYFIAEPFTRDVTVGSTLSISGVQQGLQNLQLTVNGTVVGSLNAGASTSKSNFTLNSTYQIPTALSTFTGTISGTNSRGDAVLKTNRLFRIVPSAKLSSVPFNYDFQQIPSFAGIYNPTSPASQGWILKDGALKIAVDPKTGLYADNVDTSFTIFTQLPAGKYQLSINATVDTEATYDFFYVYAKNKSGQVAQLLKADAISDHQPRPVSQTWAIDDSVAEIILEFVSDPGTEYTGVTVSKIAITAAAP